MIGALVGRDRHVVRLDKPIVALDTPVITLDTLVEPVYADVVRSAAAGPTIAFPPGAPNEARRAGMGKDSELERQKQRESERAARDRTEKWVRCGACGHALAPDTARLEVDGRHVHTFVNPQGIEYTIGCWREAPGCRGLGEESTFWSWFPGFAWRIALCARCSEHVGWSFRADGGAFAGLIVDRVRAP